MNEQLKVAFERGELVLLLGAGTSLSSLTFDGKESLLGGDALAEKLLQRAGIPYSGEALPVAYAAAKRELQDRIWPFLESKFQGCRPAPELLKLATYPWARIYTLNIDDALDRALAKNSKQNVVTKYRFDRVTDNDPFYGRLEFVKLNGSINRQADGLIFSPQEYGASSANQPLWYKELSADFFKFTFLFVGTRLAEPLFYHQVESYRIANNAKEGRSFVLTPSATAAEKIHLQDLNLEHIPGTLKDFVEWLERNFPTPPAPMDLAIAQHPELADLAKREIDEEHLKLLESLISVNRRSLATARRTNRPAGSIREFYRGFKPEWNDIIDEVPATLSQLASVIDAIPKITKERRVVLITGPAGSGKTTTLMQAALRLADLTPTRPVYYLNEPVDAIDKVIDWLEKTSPGEFILCLDRISNVADGIKRALTGDRLKKCILLVTERQNAWSHRVGIHLTKYVGSQITLGSLTTEEANAILEKLERFGPWTRLAKLKPSARVHELMNKAKRQLLIALLETTSGRGFEKIIEDDFSSLTTPAHRHFVAIVGLATIHRLPMKQALLQRSLSHIRITEGMDSLISATVGIIVRTGDKISARHQTYVEYLFERVLSKEEKIIAINALLRGFAAYESPLLASVGRVAATLFKLTINHRFLKNAFRSDEAAVIGVYESFEKVFQPDGLFWLQYGLALRDFDRNADALDRLRTAQAAYPGGLQTDHALAQQLLIMAARVEQSKPQALAMLEEAKATLLRLDARRSEFESDYPIVTLSEGHVAVIHRFEGAKSARRIAKDYANAVAARMKDEPGNPRLRDAWKRLSLFSTGGRWRAEKDFTFA